MGRAETNIPGICSQLLEFAEQWAQQAQRPIMIFRFENRELDTGTYELRLDGRQCPVEPRVFDILAFLLGNSDRVVSRDELLAELWPGRVVSDATLSTCIKAARRAVGDDGQAQRLIKTVHGRGFRFVGEVVQTGDTALPWHATIAAAAVSRRTSIALLPFDVFSHDPQLTFFADSLVEDLTTLLARTTGLLVISRSSSFAYKGTHPSAARVREDMGVECMLEGSLRPSADLIRINVQLINTVDDSHLWARQFDCPAPQLSSLQDEIINAIGQVLEPELVRISYTNARSRDCDRDAQLLYQQANGLLALRGWHPDTFAEAVLLLRRSIAIDPKFARAYAYLALILALGHRVGLLHQREQALLDGLRAADTALDMDDIDSTVLGFAGCALADLGQVDRAMPVIEKAIEQDPSNAQAWAALGAAKIADRKLTEGIDDLRHGIRISPLDNRLAVWGSFLAIGLMLSGDLDDATVAAKAACRRDIRNHIPRIALAAVLLAARRPGQARPAIAEAYRLRPELSAVEINCLVGTRMSKALEALRRVRIKRSAS
jgi:TolB-like protein